MAYAKRNAEAEAEAKAKAEVLTPLYNLATDCLRLSMHFFHPIQQCAQQVHHSALPLSPTSSLLHKSCLQSVIDNPLSHVASLSGAPDAWGLLLRTIDVRPRELTCIATSVQGIVAACEDTVNIYDAVTGVLRQFLCAPETVTHIHGSPDGSILFFGHPSSVTMWDVQTGGLIDTFTTQPRINDFAVSTTHIACGSSNGFIRFWNIHTKVKGEGFENGQPVVKICWLSPQRLAVATQNTLHVHDIIVGETLGRISVPGHIWGMVYLGDKDEFLVGTSEPILGVDYWNCSFLRYQLQELQDSEPLQWWFKNLGQSPVHFGPLSGPKVVGHEILCITQENGIQLFDTNTYDWTNNPPLLGAATSVAVSSNRNLVVQTKDSIQIFSLDVLTSNEAHNDIHSSHIYPLGGNHIICIHPTRHLTLLELGNMQKLHPGNNTPLLKLLLTNQQPFTQTSFRCGLVEGSNISMVMQAWQMGTPLPEWTEVADEEAPLSRLSPKSTWVVIVNSLPQPEIQVKDAQVGTILANLPLADDDWGMGKVYDLIFDSETRFYVKIDGPVWHVQIPHDIMASPSGNCSHTIIKGKPMHLSEPRAIPTYTLDENCEWVIDVESRKICWIPPGNVRRGNGGHFWAGLSLVMVGDDGVVRKLTFKEPVRGYERS